MRRTLSIEVIVEHKEKLTMRDYYGLKNQLESFYNSNIVETHVRGLTILPLPEKLETEKKEKVEL